ncbi:hypothetical protein B0I35DRAFT_412285 [Stachybotrys elegans]|uniref:Uncharacterized protein n=1 Tax=Stachybotrys elegans TaxID=80388 RepID=A0A8K0SJ25_9HYPO|nr:hypothetical protein B0I35DRAFT_412285 [Stachybotrys elegans]
MRATFTSVVAALVLPLWVVQGQSPAPDEWAVTAYENDDCTGAIGGSVSGIPTYSYCLETKGRKSIAVFSSRKYKVFGIGSKPASGDNCASGDVQTGCTSGEVGQCIKLMHPNGDYFDYTNVHMSTGPTTCYAGKLI